MNALESLEKSEIKELLSKGWMTHDAMWFAHSLEEVGIEKTNKINKAAVRSMSVIEMARIKKALGYNSEAFTSFEELAAFLQEAMELVKAKFMRFTMDISEKNVIRWEMEKDQCFAFKGVTGMGVIDQYECGVLYRIEAWLNALQVPYEMKPVVTNCLMHTKGECKGEFVFNLD